MIKVKICGVTNLADAEAAVRFGADALGFVFYKQSKRYIDPDKARNIISKIDDQILKVGVFVNAGLDYVHSIEKQTEIHLLQMHGDETPEYCESIGSEYIKAFRIKDSGSALNINEYKTNYILFDSYSKSEYGGTGKKFDWELLNKTDLSDKCVIISGGLNSENVVQAIEAIRPYMVDISSGVEKSPGKKDHKKIKEFIEVVNNER